jgi:hypothetical protein
MQTLVQFAPEGARLGFALGLHVPVDMGATPASGASER